MGTPCALELPCITNAKPNLSSPFITPISKHGLNVFTLERKGSNQLNLSNYHIELTHTTHKCPKCPKECSLCKRLDNFPPSFTHCFLDFFKKKDFIWIFFCLCLPINVIIYSYDFKSRPFMYCIHICISTYTPSPGSIYPYQAAPWRFLVAN